jgi:hypothetical protein
LSLSHAGIDPYLHSSKPEDISGKKEKVCAGGIKLMSLGDPAPTAIFKRTDASSLSQIHCWMSTVLIHPVGGEFASVAVRKRLLTVLIR